MNRTPRFAIVLTLASVLLLAPMAGARTVEGPRTAPRVEAGWVDNALSWLEGLAGVRRSAPQAPKPRNASDKEAGGSCIDPQGNPRPLPWCV